MVAFFFLLAIGISRFYFWKGFSFGMWVFGAVTLAMYYPDFLQEWGSFDLKLLIIPLLQLIMFGMGTSMSLKDFSQVVSKPKAVMVGLACQFTIMPIVGVTLATVFGFPPEVAAGIVLVGSSPSGLASNVMAYIARANLALSITLTTIATLLAPLTTPLLMKLLAGQMVPIDFLDMMWGVTKIVILPILCGLAFNRLLHGRTKWLDKAMPILSMTCIAIVIAIITASGRDSLLQIGLALVLVSLIHNGLGYLFGYWGCRIIGMDEASCRTIAIEVGMQNSGLASGIALQMGKVATVGLAPAVFGPLMNVTGSSLASWWRERKPLGNPKSQAPIFK
jgi:BASS family bile acid:Na+ symporter